ncbi:PPOX class F420-dependent oxidoreductase [Dactylosporangium sp. CA-139066]|uniref:PPOX class F420-dependent oxidoreductase n=1 Tax=Dactylosporangium sp. CA-139066 TaxID=3239930 RepID=UPI003D94C882
MSVLEDIARGQYISLVSFRRDGTPRATPVWHVVYDGEVVTVSEERAWKVKRIRNNPRVTVTVCDIRGRIKPGAVTAEGTARLLDAAGTETARAQLRRKYVTARIGFFFQRLLRLRRPPAIGIAIKLA